jgi:penicillin-binding protein 2
MVHALRNIHTLKDHFKESQLYLNRAVIAAVLVFIVLITLIIRLVYLQIFQHDVYKTLSLNNQVRIVPITPTRGLIFDRNGVLLAENMPAFSLELTPERTPHIDETLKIINDIMPLTDTERQHFYKQLKYKRRNESIPIRIKLSEEEVAKFSVEKHRIPGVDIVARLIRHYPFGESLAHALGYIGPISEKDLTQINTANYRGTYNIGKIGVEKFYEDVLHGTTGYQHIETDAKGRTIRVLNRIPPVSGKDLYLSLDNDLQSAATEALKDLKGAIVAIDPNNGEVLALVSNPAFDPNLFTQGIDVQTYTALQNSPDRPLFNRAIRGQYPPGSTVKPMVALQGLELGTVTPQFQIFDPGWYKLNGVGRMYRDWIYFARRHGHGTVDMEKAIAQSCDTYFFTLAHKLGVKHLHNIFTRFGLGKTTNIDTTGEASGLVPSADWKKRVYKDDWYPGDTLNIGIGQGMLLATPLQVAQFAAIIANRGQGFEPHFAMAIGVDETQTPIKQKPKAIPPIILKQDANWDIIIKGMQKVVQPGGTASSISHGLTYTVAGKTGTAQVFNLKQHEKYEVNKIKAYLRDHSWFIAFAPVEKPEIVLAVLVENKYKKTGKEVARIVLDSYFHSKVAAATSDEIDNDEDDESEVGGEENSGEENVSE